MKASSVESAVAIRVRIAAGLFARARGLLRHPAPAPGAGLLLAGVRIVHGFGLKRALDLVYLDGNGRVLACDVLAPWHISGCFAAAHVIELRRGECERLQLLPGRLLRLVVVEDIFGSPQDADRSSRAPPLPAARFVIAMGAIALLLAARPCLASDAAAGAGNVNGNVSRNASGRTQESETAERAAAGPTTVEHFAGEPRRKRVRRARASLHRDAAAGTPAKPLRKARPRPPKHRQAPVEYLVGEPGRHGAKPREQAEQGPRKDEPDRHR